MLIDIEGEEIVNDLTGWTTPAYEELWLRLGEGLGLRRDEITSWKPFARTEWALSTLVMYSRWWEWTWLDGVASLYAFDLHNREYLERAHTALRDHYGLSERSLELFRVFREDSAQHIKWEEEALAYWACTRERQLTAARAFRERLDIEHQSVLATFQALTAEQLPVQTP
jgi:pyrroloquinoline quinone (PQQ) biosynthesis protein C